MVTEQIQRLHQQEIAELQRAHHVQASAKHAAHQEELRSTRDEWHRQVRRMRDEHAEELTMLRNEREAAERGLVAAKSIPLFQKKEGSCPLSAFSSGSENRALLTRVFLLTGTRVFFGLQENFYN
jgi:hypothetical protein